MSGYGDFHEPNDNPDSLPIGGLRIDFNNPPVSIDREYREMEFEHTLGIMCDEKGELLFYTNGDSIMNSRNETIENSERFNIGDFWTQIRLSQAIVILPAPKQENEFYLFHEPRDEDGDITNLYYSKVDMNANRGSGKVTEKSILLLSDSLDAVSYTHLTLPTKRIV